MADDTSMVRGRSSPKPVAPNPDHWWSTLREIGSIRVIWVDLTPHGSREASAFSWLDESEQDRWRRFQHPGPRRRFALCRPALRSLLCSYLQCTNEQLAFDSTRYGKPFAVVDSEKAPVSFNVSHSGSHGLIAYAPKGRLGVDVEEQLAGRDTELLIDTVYGPTEQADLALLHGCHKTRLFYKLWTIKEALIKAVGVGFSCDVSQFEIPRALRGGTARDFVFPQVPTERWQVQYLGNREFAGAIAYEAGCEAGF